MIKITEVSKKFGNQEVLRNINLTISEGQIFGLLGKNGAGKTTLMKIILGLTKMDHGSIAIFEENVSFGETPTNRHIGYLPDVPSFYPFMTAGEYLRYCGEITGLNKEQRHERAEKYLQLVGLENNKKRISGFSRGMKQRLGIAQALLHQPKILICDEPTSALDPIGRRDILEILQKIKHETTVIFSTHILTDAEKICDEIALIHNGEFVLSGNLKTILNAHQKQLLVVELQSTEDQQKFQARFPQALCNNDQLLLSSSDLIALQKEVFEFSIEQQMIIQSITIKKASLDEIFMEVTAK